MIEAAAGAKPEETSLDALRLEQQAHGSLEEAVESYISCSLKYLGISAVIPGATKFFQIEVATLCLYPGSLSWLRLAPNLHHPVLILCGRHSVLLTLPESLRWAPGGAL